MVLMIACLAGGSLWILGRIPRQSVQEDAARRAIEQGVLMTAHLAGQPNVASPPGDDEDWSAFIRQIRALQSIEPGLQYVTVSRNGVAVFSKQTSRLEPEAGMPEDYVLPEGAGKIAITRKRLMLEEGSVPVLVFLSRGEGADGMSREVEIAIRRDGLLSHGQEAVSAVSSMFKLSLTTIVIAFGLCAAVVVWVVRRETVLERRRREQEHLAFAGVLANGIVHDFRNPMSSVRLDVQMLGKETARQSDCNLARIAALAARIENTIQRMDKVFEEFLYVSRPSSEERERTDLVACVRECVQVVERRFGQAGIGLDVRLPPESVRVQAYPSALQRAVLNVVTNAEQFSKAGQRVAVVVEVVDDEAIVTVDDEGPGVPEKRRETIFEMFESDRPGGTGLGLFLARTAIERCGGHIDVGDAPKGGARFRIRLAVVH